ncbi:MAG TPA: hypothetical protein DHV59_15645 [Oxalobacteraceae bacterium]|nr:hypothetical protein [Oxalobacteraceae bacterium]
MKSIVSVSSSRLPFLLLPHLKVGRHWRKLAIAACLAALSAPAAAVSNVVISQVYGGGGNSGATYRNDFIELFNRSAAPVSIHGWSLQYSSASGASWQVTTLPSLTLQPGQYLLLQQASGSGGTTSLPTPDAVDGIFMSSTAGKIILANTVTPVSDVRAASVLDLVGFGATANAFEGSGPAPAPSNTMAVVRAGNGCADTDNNGGDFAVAAPAPRNSSSPFVVCSGVTPPGVQTIPQIQGSGASSPFVGTRQTTEGVVTHKVSNGFYLQDAGGDGNPATSDGIFVFTGAAPTVTVGDKIRLTANVAEFNAGNPERTVTQLSGVSGLTVLASGQAITPLNLTLPLAHADHFERYEGMLVRFAAALTVSQNYFQGRYGQVTLSAGRLEKPTNRYRAGTPEVIAATAANAANMIVLDDNRSSQNPNPIPYIGADNTLRAGDTVSNLTGVVDFGLITNNNPGPTAYKLQPTVTPAFMRVNQRTSAPALAAGDIRVASFNVLNFFTTFGDGKTADGQSGQGCREGAVVSAAKCRGADNLQEFLRQRAKIVSAMAAINADVFGLMEIQNNGDVAATNLVEALNAVVGQGTYAVVPMPPVAGATGEDAIRVAMIYKPAKLRLVGEALADTDPVNNRPPMAQAFSSWNGKRFSVIVNHLKSKSSCPAPGSADADRGDGQGCWNTTRVTQARRLISALIPRVQAAAKDPDVLVIGDLNAYGAEEPVNALTAAGLVNQIERFVRPSALPYSYVFDGEAGYLDHALTTASLSAQVVGLTEWHINTDEPSVIDYNTEFKPQDLYSATPYRSSDHDPVVISLDLENKGAYMRDKSFATSSASTFNRATQTTTGK